MIRHGIKLILLFKVIAIGYIMYTQGFFVGEKNLSAQNSKVKPEKAPMKNLISLA